MEQELLCQWIQLTDLLFLRSGISGECASVREKTLIKCDVNRVVLKQKMLFGIETQCFVGF